jgi:hypothetical protein
MRRTMKSSKPIKTKVLILVTMLLLGVTLTGCIDPVVAQMEAEHERLGAQLEREMQMYGFPSPATPPRSSFYPAP